MPAITLLSAVTSTGAGTIKHSAYLMDKKTVQVSITGAPSAVTVTLEGSIDGTNFATLATKAFSAGELTATFALFHSIDTPVTYVRANLTVLTGGSTPTVTAIFEGDKHPLNKVSRHGVF